MAVAKKKTTIDALAKTKARYASRLKRKSALPSKRSAIQGRTFAKAAPAKVDPPADK